MTFEEFCSKEENLEKRIKAIHQLAKSLEDSLLELDNKADAVLEDLKTLQKTYHGDTK